MNFKQVEALSFALVLVSKLRTISNTWCFTYDSFKTKKN